MARLRNLERLFDDDERAFLLAVLHVALANPFLPERIDAERAALGREFSEVGLVMINLGTDNENVRRIGLRLVPLLDRIRERLAAGATGTDEARALYREVCLYSLYDRFDVRLGALLGKSDARVTFYDEFAREHDRLVGVLGPQAIPLSKAHLFACFFQIRRAYYYLFTGVLGGSLIAARLRAAVWQAIFTSDLRAYQEGLFECVGDVPTLVTGPTGTGKELVAQAIGHARYIPFDEGKKRFVVAHDQRFFPLNLSALSPSLIESELFGHQRGSFTGAVKDTPGWLEEVGPWGTIFLDEIGELDERLQVKLLRVLEKRTYQRLGERTARRFEGRIVSATNRDLSLEMATGAFRRDLYYRLCGQLITTPTLRAQLDEAPGELGHLVRFFAAKVSKPRFAEALAERSERWIATELPPDYPWPGNVRELEQCVRSIMMSRCYRPAYGSAPAPRAASDDFHRKFDAGELTVDEIVGRYATVIHAQTGSHRETARRLGIGRQQVAGKLDQELLARLLAERSVPRQGE